MVKKISSILAIILVVCLISLTIYKLNKRHEDKLYDVLYSKIKYEAKQCFLDKKCESTMTLEELYNKKYLEVQYDPISKEELNSKIEIKITDEKIEIVK